MGGKMENRGAPYLRLRAWETDTPPPPTKRLPTCVWVVRYSGQPGGGPTMDEARSVGMTKWGQGMSNCLTDGRDNGTVGGGQCKVKH